MDAGTNSQLIGPDPERLLVQSLDALSAVFDRESGMTHLLASPMPELLATMAGWAGTPAALAARLAQQFDFVDDEAGVMAQLSARLDELVTLGLVERR